MFVYVYSDIKIATAQSPKDISELAAEIGLLPHEFDLYGKKKAKVSLSVLDRLSHQPNGSYVIVTGSVCVLVYVSIMGLISVMKARPLLQDKRQNQDHCCQDKECPEVVSRLDLT